jgi:hypothetical protein
MTLFIPLLCLAAAQRLAWEADNLPSSQEKNKDRSIPHLAQARIWRNEDSVKGLVSQESTWLELV